MISRIINSFCFRGTVLSVNLWRVYGISRREIVITLSLSRPVCMFFVEEENGFFFHLVRRIWSGGAQKLITKGLPPFYHGITKIETQ